MYEPQIVTYAVAEKGMENKGKFHDASIGVAVVDEKACLGMKRHWTVKKIKSVAIARSASTREHVTPWIAKFKHGDQILIIVFLFIPL